MMIHPIKVMPKPIPNCAERVGGGSPIQKIKINFFRRIKRKPNLSEVLAKA